MMDATPAPFGELQSDGLTAKPPLAWAWYAVVIFMLASVLSMIDRSVITGNTGGSWYPLYPQISCHDDTPITVTDSVVE